MYLCRKLKINSMQFKELYEKYSGNLVSIMNILRNHPEYLKLLISETELLPSDISDSERLYCWIHNIKNVPVCPFCGKPKKWYNTKKGYLDTCGSDECKLKARNYNSSVELTEENKTNLTILELWEKLGKDKKALYMSMQDPEKKAQLLKETSSMHSDATIQERLYCIVNGLSDAPVCPVCGKPRRYMKGKYQQTCGDKVCRGKMIGKSNASREYEESVKKGKETYFKKTGYYHNMQNPEFKKKFFEDYEEN